MKNKKGLLLGEETAKILVAVLVSIVLVVIIIVLFNFFIPEREAQKATQELNNLQLELESLSVAEPGPIEYFSLKTPEWHLFTWEFGSVCDGDFCICLCEKIDCRQQTGEELQSACTKINKPVLIKEKFVREDGTISPVPQSPRRSTTMGRPPEKFLLSFIDEEIYPFLPDTAIKAGFEQSQIPSIYFKFKDEWLWTQDPTYPLSWRPLNEAAPENVGDAKSSFILDAFLPYLEQVQNKKLEGEAYLSKFKVKKSAGFYVVERFRKI